MKACKVLLLILIGIIVAATFFTLKPKVQEWLRYKEQQKEVGSVLYAVEALDAEQRTVTIVEQHKQNGQPRTVRLHNNSSERDLFTKENAELVARGKSKSDALYIRGKLTGDTLEVVYLYKITARPAAPVQSTKEQ